jgi:hypothetical protein
MSLILKSSFEKTRIIFMSYKLVPSLYQCFETRSISRLNVVSATSAPGQASSATFERPSENFSTQL